MTLRPPFDIVTRLAVGSGGGWVDVSRYVLYRDAVEIVRGYTAEGASPDPNSCALTLRNNDGRLTPRNPLGPWYGRLRQNTPLDLSVRTLVDAFSRSVVNGWGTVEDLTWSTASGGGTIAASDYQVSSGAGTHSVPVALGYRQTYLATTSYKTVDVAVTFRLTGVTTVTGGALEPANLLLRGQSSSDYYMARVLITTSQAFQVALYRQAGTLLFAPTTVPGLTYTAGSSYRVRARVDGHTLRMKVWAVTDDEPYAWHATVTTNWINNPGFVGIRSGIASGNSNAKPVLYTYDDFEVSVPRFTGEVPDWPTEWDVSGNDVFARVSAAGILRRLGQGKKPLESAPRRYIPTSDPGLVAYWPGEDGPLSAYGEAVVGGRPLELFSPYPTTAHFSKGDLGPWLNPGIAMLGLDELYGAVEMPTQAVGSTQWAVDHIRAGSLTSDTVLIVGCDWRGTSGLGVAQQWTVRFIRDLTSRSGTVEVTTPTGTVVSAVAPLLFDGLPHHIRFACQQSGANTGYFVDLDGDNLMGFVGVGITLQPAVFVDFQNLESGGPGSGAPLAIGHVTVYAGSRPLSNFARPVLGWRDEAAGRRIERLCAESGIPFSYQGDLDATTTMGSQPVETFMDVIRAAVDADGGLLFEPRGGGVGYRTRESLYNQDDSLPLDLEVPGHIGAPFRPSGSPDAVRNDVIVKRLGGGEARVEVTTGPLSTEDPPDGAGRYESEVELQLYSPEQCLDQAGWRAHLGTWDGDRYEAVRTLPVRRPDLLTKLAAVEVGDRSTVSNLPAHQPPDQVDQLISGYSETLTSRTWEITLVEQPAGPWYVWELEHAVWGALDTDGSSLNAGIAAATPGAAGSLSIATDAGFAVWTTDAANWPQDIRIGGEVMTVTAVSGTSSPQTFTVTRGTNGVAPAHLAGERVSLASTHVLPL